MNQGTREHGSLATTDRSRKRSQRAFNSIARAVLGSPVHWLMSRNLMVVGVRGRKTGTLYAVPVAYADHEGQVLAASGGTWVRNLSADRPVVLVHRGRRRTARPEIPTDRARSQEIAAALLPSNPILRGNVQVHLDSARRPIASEVDDALARGVVFLAFTLED